jgi:hypothetical protein
MWWWEEGISNRSFFVPCARLLTLVSNSDAALPIVPSYPPRGCGFGWGTDFRTRTRTLAYPLPVPAGFYTRVNHYPCQVSFFKIQCFVIISNAGYCIMLGGQLEIHGSFLMILIFHVRTFTWPVHVRPMDEPVDLYLHANK